MRNYEIEDNMYRKAVELIEKRYPAGWGGAGVVHTSQGNDYTSVSIETANASAVVCIELGAMLEAHKYNEKVTHCMCLVRDDENSPYRVLTPCGICQERLRYWGEEVQVAVTTEENQVKFVELRELQPYHWTKAYPADELEHCLKGQTLIQNKPSVPEGYFSASLEKALFCGIFRILSFSIFCTDL